MKNRIQLLVLLLIVGTQTLQAQVKGVSYTLSPSIEYSNWAENTGISDGYSIGGQFGFGFGQFVELRANYLQSINLQRDFSNFDFDNFNNELLAEQDVTVTRYGGELKLNLAKGGVVPFLTAGTGIQNVERSIMADSSDSRKSIFFSGGGGLQFSLGDRYTLALQAVNTSFNSSPVRNLLDEVEKADIGIDGADFGNVALNNWSYRASILLYLGGRRPGELTDTDKAYMENFSNGFRGLSLPIEVTAGQINFGDGLPYADTKFTGVSSGFDFGPYVGLRAFYWRSIDDGYFSDFNRLALYGGEGKFKLSTGQGLTPYLNVGGGVIDPLSGFTIDGIATDLENTPFVSGGLGIDLPFSRAFKLSAYAKALLTSNDTATENIDPNELSTSVAYGLSADFIIGSRSKQAREIAKNDGKNYDDMVSQSMKQEKGKADKLKKDYQERIEKLDEEIDKAYEDGDMELMTEKYEERESAQRFVNRIGEIEKKEAEANGEKNINTMNPSEFSKMMKELQESNEKSQQRINDRLDSIEKSLNNNNNDGEPNNSNMTDREKKLQKELDELKKKVEKSRDETDNAQDEVSDREKELQKEIDDLKKQARKGTVNAQDEVSDREKELQKEIDDLKKQARKGKNDVEAEISDLEQDLQIEVNELKKQLGNATDDAEDEISDREKELQKEIDDLKKEMKQKSKSVKSDVSEAEQKLEKEVEQLKKQSNDNSKNNSQKKSNDVDAAAGFRMSGKKNQNNASSIGFDDNDSDTQMMEDTTINYLTESQQNYNSENLPDSSFFSNFNYDGASILGGFNVGGSTTLNLGVRSHYRYKETNFYVMPEAFFGFGNPASFGLFANGIYQLNLKNNNSFAPYAGVGFGVLNIGDELDNRTKLAANIVLGANLFKVAEGRFYVDLSARNFFKYNQLVAGYRLPF
jgi:hypothetical protein